MEKLAKLSVTGEKDMKPGGKLGQACGDTSYEEGRGGRREVRWHDQQTGTWPLVLGVKGALTSRSEGGAIQVVT